MEHSRYNVIGSGLTLASLAVPWYMTFFCQLFLAFWLFDLPWPTWLVLIPVAAGGILSLFSRYGGVVTIASSLVFAATFTTGQPSGYFVVPPSAANNFVCQPGSSFYQVGEPLWPHVIGFWVALAGGILTLALGTSWTMPFDFMLRHSRTIVGPDARFSNT